MNSVFLIGYELLFAHFLVCWNSTFSSSLFLFEIGRVSSFGYCYQFICLLPIVLPIGAYDMQLYLIFNLLFFFLFFSQFKGSTPSACWNKIYKRIRNIQNSAPDGSNAEGRSEAVFKSGSEMFGFTNTEVMKLIQVYLCVS